jgi:hypothetical protein
MAVVFHRKSAGSSQATKTIGSLGPKGSQPVRRQSRFANADQYRMNKVPVSKRTLIARINRRLHEYELIIRRTISKRARLEVGDYYALDTWINAVFEKNIDLETYGRNCGALQDWEVLVE